MSSDRVGSDRVGSDRVTLDRATYERLLKALDRASDALERGSSERAVPVAIVGMACRFPGGADSPERFAEMLFAGLDGVGEMPAARWERSVPAPRGGFLPSIADFDAEFFGISGREALQLDPQQRFLLELTWEALERAGIPADGLRGSKTGVFTGVTAMDYSRVLEAALSAEELGGYFMTGNALNFCAGRVAWKFGFEGPAITVDTACSSSLAAIHLACRSLRAGECTVAIASGVNLLSWPAVTESLTKAGMLSGDGRCRTFSADAGGYGRGEGCGVLVLERLPDALKNGRTVLATIRGSAVNQDGASSGLTVPNGRAQQAVIRAALQAAGVAARDVGYLECHGTGTPLGDPVEVHAAAAVYGEGRERALPIGSVKTNIGHLEAAAGVAAVCKAVLALRAGEIPAHLHFGAPNPYIDWDAIPVAVAARRQAWVRGEKPLLAGVSSFGASGTNVHLILEEAPGCEAVPVAREDGGHLLVLSARSAAALEELKREYRALLGSVGAEQVGDICFSAAVSRSHLNLRFAASGDREALLAQLAGNGEVADPVVQRYLAGEEIDWDAHYAGRGFRRVSIPVYPFQRRRYWPASKTADEGHWYYRVEWRAKPVWSGRADFFPPLADALVSREFDADSLRRYEGLLDALDEVASAYAKVALQRVARPGGGPAQARLFRRLREMAGGDADPQLLLQNVTERWPEAATEVALIRRCGAALADAVSGPVDSTAILFPATGEPTAADLYNDAFGARVMNAALGATVRALCAEVPLSRRMRVLEIGAGTGSATAAVLDALPGGRTEYLYTDISAGFFGRAKARFGDRDFIQYRTFDAERDAAAQGIERGSIDLAIASNVLHATRDLAAALRNVAAALAPGGVLVLLEGIQRLPFTDAIFGLTDGWWRFEDDGLRQGHPLLSRGAWLEVLKSAGFEECGALAAESGLFAKQTILAARKPLGAAESGAVVYRADECADPALGLLALAQRVRDTRVLAVTDGSPEQAVVSGLAASLEIERPDLDCVRVEVAGDDTRCVEAESFARDGERVVRYRGGERFVARLVSEKPRRSARPAITGTWLVTGGLNGLGLFTAEWLAERGATHLALLGRRLPQAIPEIAGVRVRAFAADVSDEAELAEALQAIRGTMPPLRGVVHSAGVLADGLVSAQTPRSFAEVFAPKVTGGWNLHRLTLQDPLDYFVLYSSGVSILGSPGQSNHAAANSYLNALAEYRVAQGLPGLSLAWGRWSEIGSAASAEIGESSRRRGMQSISPERGRRALDDLFGEQGTVGVFSADWKTVAAQFPSGAPALLSELVEGGRTRTASARAIDLAATAREAMACEAAGEKEALVGRYLGEAVRQILGLESAPAAETPLIEMGFDSLVSTELRNRLLFDLRVDVPMKVLLSGISVGALRTAVLEGLLVNRIARPMEGAREEAVEEFII
jgi:3-oxoacyl-(acyl-carrier-protein) synthase/SAM-dependent methyltransferase